jgi:PAS domain S-box-containing protein
MNQFGNSELLNAGGHAACVDQSAVQIKPHPETSGSGTDFIRKPAKILLVDDDEDDYIITRDLITRIGDHTYQVEWVNHFDAAILALQRGGHAACLLDYRLGERTGLELLRETHSFSRRPPMILLTGQGDHEIDVEAMKAGAADYLIKGQLTSDMLERAIRYAIERQRDRENLRRDRDLISRIMETSPVGIVVTDPDGIITFANQCAEKVLGLTQEAINARTAGVLDWHLTGIEGSHPLEKQTLTLKQVIESGQVVQNACHTIEFSDHRSVQISVNATPLLAAGGKIDGLVVTVEDITARLALESQLRQTQKMKSVGQLAAGVAHDINNILTIIQGHAGILHGLVPPDDNAARSLKQIADASDRAAGFIRHLLMFSRKQVVQTKTLDLNVVLHNLEYMVTRMLGESIALETRHLPDLPAIVADTSMLEQIVMNLVANARDAMPDGGKLLIETSAVEISDTDLRQSPDAHSGEFVVLTVTDTGCGMEPKVLQHIFEPFFTTKEPGKGTGIGLATVYGIVKQHQGWIEVESRVGIGTTFKIFLPVIRNQTVPVPAAVPPEPKTIPGGPETILIVEDEVYLLEMAREVLQHYHYRILTASSGPDALRVWDENEGRIDMLLTDMLMPGGMTGNELARELKKRKPEIKVVFSSGYSPELIGRDLGQSDTIFLPKPYHPEQLAQTVRAAFDAASGKPAAT